MGNLFGCGGEGRYVAGSSRRPLSSFTGRIRVVVADRLYDIVLSLEFGVEVAEVCDITLFLFAHCTRKLTAWVIWKNRSLE